MTQTNRKSKTQKLPDLPVDPVSKLEELNQELRAAGYEVVVRRVPTRDVVAFDFGLVFTADSNEVGLYIDDQLRELLEILAKEKGQILIKTNWFSPDVMVVTAAENPDPLQNTPDTETAASLNAPVASQDGSGATEATDPIVGYPRSI